MENKPPECKGCPLEFIGEGYIPPRGRPDSKLYIVGEVASKGDVKDGRPFSAGRGRILNSLLTGAGVDPSRVYMDSVARCKPPNPKTLKKFDPIDCSIRHLFPVIKKEKPNVIIAMGEGSLRTLTGLPLINKRRGSLYKTVHGKVVPTLDPGYIMYQQHMFFVVAADIKKAVRESLFPEKLPMGESYNIFPTMLEIEGWELDQNIPLAVDIETTWDKYWNCALLCIGFSTLERTICIPWYRSGEKLYWPPKLHVKVVRQIQRLLNHPSIFQNGFFDVQVLETIGFKVPNFIFDTMLAHHLLYAELPHDLGFICSLHTPLPYYKDESKSDDGALSLSDKTFRTYNCNDAFGTMIAAQDLGQDMRTAGKWGYFKSVTMNLPRILINMQKLGICVDIFNLKQAIISYTHDVKRLKAERDSLNIPDGTKALKEFLFEELNLPIGSKSRKTKQPSLDKDSVSKILIKIMIEEDRLNGQTGRDNSKRLSVLQQGQRALNLIGNLNRKNKVLSTYLRGLPIGPDGRVHCSWLQHGTKNQRLSSRSPNLQNVPEGIARRIYTATPGHLLYSADYSQIELRIIAYEAEDYPLIKAFEEGRDPHGDNARVLFNISPQDSYTEAQRKFAKAYVYCLNYGGDIMAVLIMFPGVMSVSEGKRAQKRYYREHPAISRYRKGIEKEIRENRTVVNPFGLKRVFFGSISDNIKSAYNYPIQSGAAYVINCACIRLHRRGLMMTCVAQHHDALMFDSKRPRDIRHVVEEMQQPVWIKGRKVDLPVDLKAGRNWENMRTVDVGSL